MWKFRQGIADLLTPQISPFHFSEGEHHLGEMMPTWKFVRDYSARFKDVAASLKLVSSLGWKNLKGILPLPKDGRMVSLPSAKDGRIVALRL